MHEYTDWTDPQHRNETANRDHVLQGLSDVLYNIPTLKVAKMHAKGSAFSFGNSHHNLTGENRQRTYAFVFDHETRAQQTSASPDRIQGPRTADMIAYILGYPHYNPMHYTPLGAFGEDDKAFTNVMMRYVANFVRTGFEAMLWKERTFETLF